MQDLRTMLEEKDLDEFRAAFDPESLAAANVDAFSTVYPPLSKWAQVTSDTFFDDAMDARDRERCIIALLAQSGPPLSLAVHIYWGLMEGLTTESVCQAVALAGCYGGLPRAAQAMLVLQSVLQMLVDYPASDTRDATQVFTHLLARFSSAG